MCNPAIAPRPPARGYTLVELVLVIAVLGTLVGLTVPAWNSTIDRMNTAAAARHVASRIALARLDAVRRSSVVGFRFEQQGGDYTYRPMLDRNGNGLRAADVTTGVDVPLGPPERLSDQFRGVHFGLGPGIPEIDGGTGNTDGVRIGSTTFLSLTPVGSATGGTLYVRGARVQYAIRIFGATGRTRLFFYDSGARRWVTR